MVPCCRRPGGWLVIADVWIEPKQYGCKNMPNDKEAKNGRCKTTRPRACIDASATLSHASSSRDSNILALQLSSNSFVLLDCFHVWHAGGANIIRHTVSCRASIYTTIVRLIRRDCGHGEQFVCGCARWSKCSLPGFVCLSVCLSVNHASFFGISLYKTTRFV